MKKIVKGLGVFCAVIPVLLVAAEGRDKQITRQDLYSLIDKLHPEGFNGAPFSSKPCFQNASLKDLLFLTECQINGEVGKKKNLERYLKILGGRLQESFDKAQRKNFSRKKKTKNGEPDPFTLVAHVQTIVEDMKAGGYVKAKRQEPEWWTTAKWCAATSFVTAVWASLAWAEASDAQEL